MLTLERACLRGKAIMCINYPYVIISARINKLKEKGYSS